MMYDERAIENGSLLASAHVTMKLDILDDGFHKQYCVR